MHYILDALDVPEHAARIIEIDAELSGATVTGHLRKMLVDYAELHADDIAARITRREELLRMGTHAPQAEAEEPVA